MAAKPIPRTVDEYIAGFAPDVEEVLWKVRRMVRAAAPMAEETISLPLPAFKIVKARVLATVDKSH